MLPIINILLIVGILLFILYNLYIDTRNWSNTGSFLEGMENASSLAEYMGAFGGPVENYSFSSADEAKAKCEAEGLQLCTKEEVIAGAKSKASLENVCSAGVDYRCSAKAGIQLKDDTNVVPIIIGIHGRHPVVKVQPIVVNLLLLLLLLVLVKN